MLLGRLYYFLFKQFCRFKLGLCDVVGVRNSQHLVYNLSVPEFLIPPAILYNFGYFGKQNLPHQRRLVICRQETYLVRGGDGGAVCARSPG